MVGDSLRVLPTSSTTKTGRHDIAESGDTNQKSINQSLTVKIKNKNQYFAKLMCQKCMK
jgi:hypothetical protein